MKILLINPPSFNTIGSCLPKIIDEGRGFTPPLGLMYIAGYLEKYTNHQIEILDSQIEQLNYEQLKQKITDKKPDVVGITALTFTLIDVIKTAKIAKEINPNIKVILGGPHPTIYPKETAKINEVDFCIIGEGEKAILKLIENINDPEKLKQIKGIAFLYKNEIINTGQTSFVENLDDLPFPARHLLPYKKYFWSLSPLAPITTMFTSRGCPYKCLFCDRPQLGRKFRFRSAKNVVDEMEECQKMGIQEIFIYDDTFGINRQRVLDICSEIRKRNLSIAWNARTRVDTVDEEIIKEMKRANCKRIHYGVESGVQKILDILRKGISLEMVEKTFKLTKRIGIDTAAYFMIGSPTETKKDILETIKFMNKLNPDYVHITITVPYPATDLYYLKLSEKTLPDDYWQKFAENPQASFTPRPWEENLTEKELFHLLRYAYRSFYFRPNYILKKIFQLTSWQEFKNKTRAAYNLFRV